MQKEVKGFTGRDVCRNGAAFFFLMKMGNAHRKPILNLQMHVFNWKPDSKNFKRVQ